MPPCAASPIFLQEHVMKVSRFVRGLLVAGVTAVSAFTASGIAHAADLIDTVKERGTLIVGVEGTYPPFNYVDTKTGELDGFDIDVAKLIADKQIGRASCRERVCQYV